jgi:hypothetical protein
MMELTTAPTTGRELQYQQPLGLLWLRAAPEQLVPLYRVRRLKTELRH